MILVFANIKYISLKDSSISSDKSIKDIVYFSSIANRDFLRSMEIKMGFAKAKLFAKPIN